MSGTPSGAPASPPAPWRLRPAPGLRTEAGGTVLIGGAPLRVLRLSAAGARTVAGWWAGTPVADEEGGRRLARRLLDAGLAHPDPGAGGDLTLEDVTVVVPIHGRPGELRRCLTALDPALTVIVVDDGSPDMAAIAAVIAARPETSSIHHGHSRGPSAARNAGLRAARTRFVAFVDSDCVVAPGFPGRLLAHLADPKLAIAAPRITGLGEPGEGLIARYEARYSSLDMGPAEGLVAPGTAIPYVPSAALVARVTALGDGFDESLDLGEDVDLCWRVHDAGWQVRYDPAVTVAHDHRVALRPWFARRVAYDSASAALARRHPGRVPALSLSRSGAAFWGALACGAPTVAASVAAGSTFLLARRLRGRVARPLTFAADRTARGHAHEGRHLARTLGGPWLPFVLAAAAARPRLGRRLALGIAAGLVADGAGERHATQLADAAPRLASALVRGLGVWRGCLRERTVEPLLPRLR